MHLHIKLALLMQREKIGLKIARLCLALPVMSCSELLWYFLLIYIFYIFRYCLLGHFDDGHD